MRAETTSEEGGGTLMPWRYQPVIVEDKTTFESWCLALCELHFGDDDKLESWGQPFRTPVGDDIRDLQGELTRMLMDSYKWVPVRYEDLKVGMTFERALSQKECDDIANLIDNASFFAKGRSGHDNRT